MRAGQLPASIFAGALALALFTARVDAQSAFKTFGSPTAPTGAAVVIIGESGEETESTARWLNARGIAAFEPRAGGGSPTELTSALGELRARASSHEISPRRIALLGIGRGADLAAQAAYAAGPDEAGRPALLALIWGGSPPATLAASLPPTLLIGTTRATDNLGGQIELWNKLREARLSVDAHFFSSKVRQVLDPPKSGQRPDALSWPEIFYAWARFNGLLTDEPRVAIQGMVTLDGHPLPHGYVILTPVDFVGAGPIVARVLNSTAGSPIGEFVLPAAQGPIAGRYKVDVRQNMNRWLSNSFSTGLVGGGRGGSAPTPEQIHFGHHRVLAPSIDDQKSFTKIRPTDKEDYIVEIKPGADANKALRFEVFSGAPIAPASPTAAALPGDALGGILGGPKNPGQVAYVDQIKRSGSGKVPGIPEPVLLWPNGAPEAKPDAAGVFTDEDKPALYIFPAPASNNTGAAMLILPGGGFTNRVMDTEGVQIAKFLNRHGISGFVLRYRLAPNYPRGPIPTMDAHRAMRFIRARAAEHKIAPDRIGVIGFSAGGELQGDAFYNQLREGEPAAVDPLDRVSARANFSALIYGGRNVAEPANAPPTFIFCTVEDGGPRGALVSTMNSLRRAGVPVEAHFYQVGPHGTTMSPGDPQLGQWPDLMIKWLATTGMTTRPARAR